MSLKTANCDDRSGMCQSMCNENDQYPHPLASAGNNFAPVGLSQMQWHHLCCAFHHRHHLVTSSVQTVSVIATHQNDSWSFRNSPHTFSCPKCLKCHCVHRHVCWPLPHLPGTMPLIYCSFEPTMLANHSAVFQSPKIWVKYYILSLSYPPWLCHSSTKHINQIPYLQNS